MSLKTRLATYSTIGILGLTNIIGCSAPYVKDNFPIGTRVYAVPREYADSTKIEYIVGEAISDSSTIKELVGKDGVDAVYETKIFAVKELKAKELSLEKKAGKKGFSTIINGETSFKENPIKQKSATHWYNQGIFGNNYFRGFSFAGLAVLAGYLATNHKDNNKSEVNGGRTSEGSEMGEVRGGRSDNNESGGVRK